MLKQSFNLFFCSAVFAFGAAGVQAQQVDADQNASIMAKVQRIVDGDTIHVRLPDDAQISGLGRGANVKVRIVGIDAPESCQAWGKESTKALRQMIPVGSVVLLRPTGVDKYGRLLSDVYAGESGNDNQFNVAAAMVASGNAWNWVERFSSGRYAKEELAAQGGTKGLWSDSSAQRPSEFRKEHGPCKK